MLPPVYLLAAVLLMCALHRFAPGRVVVPAPYRYLGAVPLLGGLATIAWGAMTLRRAGTTIKPFQPSSALVVDGFYRWSRNPIYVAMAVALVGLALLLGSLTPWVVVPLFAWTIDRRFVRAEEAMLAAAFGDRYAAYKARVRRWL